MAVMSTGQVGGRLPQDVVGRLRCPVCREALALRADGSALHCAAGHSFDIARQGYVNLLGGGTATGTADTAEMVAGRESFLASGQFAPVADLLAERAAALGAGPAADSAEAAPFVLDAGGGTGHYLRAVLDRLLDTASGLVLDISKYALRRAARAHPRAGAAVCDLWRPLPLRSDSVSLLLDVFAPRNAAEFHRVLRPDGALLVLTPTVRHLAELVGPLGLLTVDRNKEDRLRETLSPHFAAADRSEAEFGMRLTPAEAETLVRMGPSAHHLPAGQLRERIAATIGAGPLEVTGSVVLTVHRPR
jgi:23S rRNA (guanine745-N1)-methyltransferase